MQYKNIETKNHKSSFEVSLDQEAIGKIIDQKINEKQPTFEIAGFRKGKVPLNIIKSKIGQEVENEVLNEEISKNIAEIGEKEKLQSLIQPEIEFKVGDEVFYETKRGKKKAKIENINNGGYESNSVYKTYDLEVGKGDYIDEVLGAKLTPLFRTPPFTGS